MTLALRLRRVLILSLAPGIGLSCSSAWQERTDRQVVLTIQSKVSLRLAGEARHRHHRVISVCRDRDSQSRGDTRV